MEIPYYKSPVYKQPVVVNFAQGLDTKTDPYQINIGNFLVLNNSVFTTGNRLTKRNGFGVLTTLPNEDQTTITTFTSNLVATGSDLYTFNQDTSTWINKGSIQPVHLSVASLIRQSTSQSSPDSAVSSNGLICSVYVDSTAGACYQVQDSSSGQQLIGQTTLPSTATNPRVFSLGLYFVITFTATVSDTTHLQYIAIPINTPSSPGSAVDLSTSVKSLSTGYDGVAANGSLYLAWSESSTVIGLMYLTSTLVASSVVTISSHTSDLMSLATDGTSIVFVSFWDSSSTNGYTAAYNLTNLNQILAPTQIISSLTITEITSAVSNGILTVVYEVKNNYGSPYPVANTRSDYLQSLTVTQSGNVSSATTILRSVGLVSKAFTTNNNIYMLVSYGYSTTTSNQPSYFLIDSNGNIYLRLSYSNGAGYSATQVLSSVSQFGSSFIFPYLTTDFLATVNKTTDANFPPTQINAIYTQAGINLATIQINSFGQYSSEVANALHLTGGMLWEYDGVKPVEHGFHLWPEAIQVQTTTTGGTIAAGTYYYQFTYEWTDNSGNLHRSAPSIPVSITTTGSTSTNTLYVPTLRLTYKTSNPVRIVGYRWSTNQQVYYQFTSLTSPTLNSTTTDFATITDTNPDSGISGNNIIYTTGGVIEDIAAPASIHSTLYGDRLFLIDAEDQNLLWYSKQVIESTPVEMSDLFTIYVAPTLGAQGSTGALTAIAPMDDKLILFKKAAIYYITGTGPDNTGANSDFTDPIFVSAAVGCTNPNSIVLMPNGLMFQTDKGIWLLGRDLSTNYIGAAVESYNPHNVKSAQLIPGTTQVRFILDNGVTLMYDYYYKQWGTFNNIQAISGTLYQDLHTYLNEFGQIFQETPGQYLDGSTPVLMSFTTSWMNLANLRGFQRIYYALFLGTYYSPFKLNVQFAYDYGFPSQGVLVTPDNYSPSWGGDPVWGSAQGWGGDSNANVFQARVFPERQKCQTFQITVNEVYDSSYGVPASEGLTFSGMNFVVGVKKGYSTQSAGKSFG